MRFPVLTKALYLGTKPGTCRTTDCVKLPEDMSDPIKEEGRAAMCSLRDSAVPRLHLVVSKGRWEGFVLGVWGGKHHLGHGGGYLFTCRSSFLVISHLLGILGRNILGFEAG